MQWFPAKRRIVDAGDFRRCNRQKILVVGNDRIDRPPALTDVKLMPARGRSGVLFVVATGRSYAARAWQQSASRKALRAQDQRSDHQNGYSAHYYEGITQLWLPAAS
jgi:hypothetical protein